MRFENIYYWKNANTAEVDFIINTKDGLIPIEVKASNNVGSKSLKIYTDQYKPNYAIRISTKNFGFANGIKSVPLYATFCIK
ncbi:MAG: ATP-binding protein [Clostridia bacterium]|nr:ATP-binding protein [Clostridia bacterium]